MLASPIIYLTSFIVLSFISIYMMRQDAVSEAVNSLFILVTVVGCILSVVYILTN